MFITAFLGLFNLIMLKILNSKEGDFIDLNSTTNDLKLSYEMQDLGLEGIEFNGNHKPENESLVLKLHDSLDQPDVRSSAVSKSFIMGDEKGESEYSDKDHKNTKDDRTALKQLKSLFLKDSLKSAIKYNFSDNLIVRAAVVQISSDIVQSMKNLIVALSIYNLPDSLLIEPI